MSDIRRWEDDYFRYEGDQMTEDPEGRFVLYTDHAEAVAALTSFAVKQIMGEEEDTRRDLLASYEQGKVDERKRSVLLIADAYKQGREQGQRDMLAKCIEVVDQGDAGWCPDCHNSDAIRCLEALQEKP